VEWDYQNTCRQGQRMDVDHLGGETVNGIDILEEGLEPMEIDY
jgi:hypothetical protein